MQQKATIFARKQQFAISNAQTIAIDRHSTATRGRLPRQVTVSRKFWKLRAVLRNSKLHPIRFNPRMDLRDECAPDLGDILHMTRRCGIDISTDQAVTPS
jgi:hypothetical protein